MRTIKYLTPIVLLAVIMFAGCKPSTKNETRKWKQNKEKIANIKGTYPAFDAQLDKIAAGARVEWDKALKITDEAKKAEGMSAANDVFGDSKLVRQLGSVESRNKSIDDGIKKILNKKFKKTKLDRVEDNLSKARKKQREARSILLNADGSSLDSAQEAADKAVALLIEANGIVSRTKNMAVKKKKKKKKKKEKY